MAIANATLANTETTIFTSSGNNAITCIYFLNTDSSARTIDVHVKPLGEALAAENQIYDAVSIPAGDTFVIDAEKLILEDTDEITALASVTSVVVCTVSSIGI